MTLTTGREVFSRISTIILLFIYSFFSWLGWTIILKAYLPYLQRHRASTGASSLYQCLDEWTQRFRPPSNPLSSPSSRTTSLQDLSFQDQLTLFFAVKSSLPFNHELSELPELFHQSENHHQLPGPPANAGILHLPLCVSISTMKMWSWRV